MTKESEDNIYDNAEQFVEREKLKEFIRDHLGKKGYGVTKYLYNQSKRVCNIHISYENFKKLKQRMIRDRN